MKNGLRIGLGIVGLVAVLAVVEVPAAGAQVGFSGTFRGPHGRFSIDVGSPEYPVGSYAPYGYRVYRRPQYGYGFDTREFHCRPHEIRHSHWVPVRHYQRRWIVVEQPVAYVERPYYESDYYGGGYGDRGYDDGPYDRHADGGRYGDRYSDRRYDDRYDDGYRDDRGWRSGDRRHKKKHHRHEHSRHCHHD